MMPPQRSAFDTHYGPVAVTLRAIALDDLATRDKIVRYLQADALLKVAHTVAHITVMLLRGTEEKLKRNLCVGAFRARAGVGRGERVPQYAPPHAAA